MALVARNTQGDRHLRGRHRSSFGMHEYCAITASERLSRFSLTHILYNASAVERAAAAAAAIDPSVVVVAVRAVARREGR